MNPLATPEVVPPETPGCLVLEGRVTDGVGAPVTDAILEIWQTDPEGRFPAGSGDPGEPSELDGFVGFARAATDADGMYRFFTVKPGPVPSADGRPQAPHIDVSIFARGLNDRLVTRIYFADEVGANAADPVLVSIEDPRARETLVAESLENGIIHHDIRLQGGRETQFFAI